MRPGEWLLSPTAPSLLSHLWPGRSSGRRDSPTRVAAAGPLRCLLKALSGGGAQRGAASGPGLASSRALWPGAGWSV